jgi:Xaa-Pro aminopeptidase
MRKDKSNLIATRVEGLRKAMARLGIYAYIVPTTDPHQNEHVPACWQRRRWISGFTGSAGTVVVTKDKAGLWTDGRYHVQASEELDPGLYTLFPLGRPDVKEMTDWLAEELPEGQAVGIDPKLLSIVEAMKITEELELKGKTLRFLEENLVDTLWEDPPPLPDNSVTLLAEDFTGESVASKLGRLREEMVKFHVDAHLVSTLDSIAWLFNLRGSDIPYNPVFIAYALITAKDAVIFMDKNKLTSEVRAALKGKVVFRGYHEISNSLTKYIRKGFKVWLDPKGTSQWIHNLIQNTFLTFERQSSVVIFKAKKNPAERAGMSNCHVRDGLAMVRFIRWVEEQLQTNTITELSAAKRLDAFRKELTNFQGLSFETIVAYRDHGAIIHYTPSSKTDCELKPHGLLVVDSGGHYLDGTTDITRTLSLGNPTEEERHLYTLVLKGHIQIARVRFPRGTTGRQLDSLARRPLWDIGLDYRHGTGHGIGFYLNVHEGPQSLSPKDPGVVLEPGMVISNEPGYYHEGKYGIRIENVVIVVEDEEIDSEYGPFYRFESLTMVPLDRKLIDSALLISEERNWLNDYHSEVFNRLSSYLDDSDQHWLKAATRAI